MTSPSAAPRSSSTPTPPACTPCSKPSPRPDTAATPYTVHAEEAAIESERRARIRGLGISALFGMQVMLLSIALYASDWYGGMNAGFEQLFRWLAMMLTVPVLVWPGRTFFTGTASALRARRLTMDVPVALGLSIAFVGSAFATVTGEGDVWFDSVVMFVTLLSGARYLELLARRRATAAIRALARSAPLVATRVRAGRTDDEAGIQPDSDSACNGDDSSDRDDAGTERIPAAALRPGDRVRVRPGEVVPADGTIRSGHSAFDESLLTGESNPVARSAGSQVLAGSINGSGVVEVEVTCAGDATVLGGVLRQAEQAARERPAIAQLADRAAAWFIGGVLVLAAGVAIGWLVHDPARMIPVLVSVLVVTCPCALSLATPAAMTAALGALARAGLIATRAKCSRTARARHPLPRRQDRHPHRGTVPPAVGHDVHRHLRIGVPRPRGGPGALRHASGGVRAHRGRGRRRRRRARHRG